MLDQYIPALEKLSAIGGKHHDEYVREVKKFNECKHLRTQQYTECCMDCHYNEWYGVDPQPFLDKAMKEDAQ
jgi:hypothetical protein